MDFSEITAVTPSTKIHVTITQNEELSIKLKAERAIRNDIKITWDSIPNEPSINKCLMPRQCIKHSANTWEQSRNATTACIQGT